MRTKIAALLVLLLGSGCTTMGAPPEAGGPASEPTMGRADSMDSADRDCQVVLRRAVPLADSVEVEGTAYSPWRLVVDVSEEAVEAGAQLELLSRSSVDGEWWATSMVDRVDDEVEGIARYEVVLWRTYRAGSMSSSSFRDFSVDFIPYLRMPDGGRLFDHNRRAGDFDVYTLEEANGWTIANEEGVCPAEAPTPQTMTADSSCQVVLRTAELNTETMEMDGQRWVRWDLQVDVAESVDRGASLLLLSNSNADCSCWVETSVVEERPAEIGGYRRYVLSLYRTFVAGEMSSSQYFDFEVSFIPFLQMPDGTRLFDHNRVDDALGSYALSYDNAWTIEDDATVCQ